MELLYVWIEDYKNIHHQGFNFSPRHRFRFEPTFEYEKTKEKLKGGILTDEMSEDEKKNALSYDFFRPSSKIIEKLEGRKDEAFGVIDNITAIIGENGTGKSSLLGLIPTILQFDKSIRYILLLLDTDGHTVLCKHSSQLFISHNFTKLEEGYEKNVKVFYYSGLPNNEVISGKHVDLTLHGIRNNKGIGKKNLESENLIEQVKFVLQGNIILPFEFPDNLECRILDIDLENKENDDPDKKFIETQTTILDKGFQSKNDKIGFYKIRIHLSAIRSHFKTFRQKIAKIKLKETDKLEKLLDSLKGKGQYEHLEKLYNNLDKLSKDISTIDGKSFNIEIKKNSVQAENLPELLENYMNSIAQKHYMNFFWRKLSSGENAMLNIYSRFFSTKEQATKNQSNSILILIDEGETGFHPEWQRRYLKSLIDFLPQIYLNKRIQIILATHSPFLLSDLPQENIIFLRKGESGKTMPDGTDANGKGIVINNPLQDKKPTFAANIYTLYADGFFLNEGLIGEFAKSKINEVIDTLQTKRKLNSETKKKIKDIIEIIGEPVIKRKLLQMYQEKTELNVDEEIESLKKRLNELEKIKDDPNK